MFGEVKMSNSKTVSLMAMIVMAVISFTNLFGISAAGISVCLGVVFFFVNRALERQAFADSGLDFKAIGTDLRNKSIWYWIAMPLMMDILSITLAALFLPGYIDHVLARTAVFVSFDKPALLIVQLAVLALGEEIAWRAFFQQRLQKVLPIAPVLFISSLLFAIGHIARGSLIIVAYDVFFVFVNSVLYGMVFHKTNNAWISAISHFIANLVSVIIFAVLVG
jgi:membrane protease YdiL (CAAX protease family)